MTRPAQHILAIGIGGWMVLLVAACSSEPVEREQDPAPPAAQRSIFQDETAGQVASSDPQMLPPLETTLSFADGTSDLTQAVRAELMTVAGSPQVEAGGIVILGGHTDTGGDGDAALRISGERAEAVRDFLVEAGVAQTRIRIVAFGEHNPVAPNALPDGTPDDQGRARNRRVELRVDMGRPAQREPTLVESFLDEEAADETGPASADDPATPR